MACQVEIDALVREGFPDPHPEGGTCLRCSYCSQARSDGVPKDEYGVCTGHDEPMVVSLDEFHGWDECWTGAA